MTRRINEPDTEADEKLRKCLNSESPRSFIMVAGAGSGKTTSLVKALDFIGKQYGEKLRQKGQQVACITYTKGAVGEIWGDVGNNPLFHVSTIHRFLWTLISPFQTDISSWVKKRINEKLEKLKEERDGFGTRVQQKTRDKNALGITRLEKDLPKIDDVPHFHYGTGSRYAKGILGHDDIIKIGPQLILDHPLLAKLVAQKYLYFFVDESQDTFPEVVEALKSVAKSSDKFCLGFFGDPMQKIYMTGMGDIKPEPGWELIKKPENFRCPIKVLTVINSIRLEADDKLKQIRGRYENVGGVLRPVEGTARIFIMPPDESVESLNKVRDWLAENDSDPEWLSDDVGADVRILVIEHRMAAKRLGFSDLFSAFNDKAPLALSESFRDGTAWALKPFLNVLLPLTEAYNTDNQARVVELLRDNSEKLDSDFLKSEKNPSLVLKKLKQNVCELAQLLSSDSSATVLDVLKFSLDSDLIVLENKLIDYVRPSSQEIDLSEIDFSELFDIEISEDEKQQESDAIKLFLKCGAAQLWGYKKYQDDLSGYKTHQGVKGAQFKRVIVVLSDIESKYRLFSYEKFLGIKEPTKADREKIESGDDSVFDRTRRLLYVCCSRATKDLAVVLYVDDIQGAADEIHSSGLFDVDDVYTSEIFDPPTSN